GRREGSTGGIDATGRFESVSGRSRMKVTRAVAQGAASPSTYSMLSTTLTRPPSITLVARVRKVATGVGRRNQVVTLMADPQPLWAARASSSAVSSPAIAPPCSPLNGPAASGDGCQWPGSSKLKIDIGSPQDE